MIIYLNVELFVHHIAPKCLDEARVGVSSVEFESIPFDIVLGEQFMPIT